MGKARTSGCFVDRQPTNKVRKKPAKLVSNKYTTISTITHDLKVASMRPKTFSSVRMKGLTSILKMRGDHLALVIKMGYGIIQTGDDQDMRLRYCYSDGRKVFVLNSDIKFTKRGKWVVKLTVRGHRMTLSGTIRKQGRSPVFEYDCNKKSKLAFTKSFMPYISFDEINTKVEDELAVIDDAITETAMTNIITQDLDKVQSDNLCSELDKLIKLVYRKPNDAMLYRYCLVGTSKRVEPNDIFNSLNKLIDTYTPDDSNEQYVLQLQLVDRYVVFEILNNGDKDIVKVFQVLNRDIDRNGKEPAGFNIVVDNDVRYFTDIVSRLLFKKLFGIKPYFKGTKKGK